MFAKLYERNQEQVLVKIEGAEDGPEVRFYFEPEGFGVCSFTLGFDDTDEGWDKAEEFFGKVEEDMAFNLVNNQKKLLIPA